MQMGKREHELIECAYTLLRCLLPSKHGHLKLSVCTKCGPNHDQSTTILPADGLTRWGAQVTAAVLVAIGAVQVKLFLIRENDCVSIHSHHHVSLFSELTIFLVLQCAREGAVHCSVDRPVYIRKDTGDGARASIMLNLVEQLGGRVASRRCHSHEAPYVSACQNSFAFPPTLGLLDRQCFYHTRARALGPSRDVFQGVYGLTKSAHSSLLFVGKFSFPSIAC